MQAFIKEKLGYASRAVEQGLKLQFPAIPEVFLRIPGSLGKILWSRLSRKIWPGREQFPIFPDFPGKIAPNPGNPENPGAPIPPPNNSGIFHFNKILTFAIPQLPMLLRTRATFSTMVGKKN